ncbi:hypothetical protein [Sporosalibacterium faouarense]|uniref:hypothetical protein n=1 Tax=Sporosalibacterium faouarense TaxID=516123 RepID=UPI00192B4105|nr:hypothetical protein [Sporosalibacterium faouarense]
MKYVKIANLVQENGKCDYKGLDISKNITGKQVYPINENSAYLITVQETIPNHSDLIEITKEDYEKKVNELKNDDRVTTTDKINQQQIQIDDLTLQLGDALLGGAI